MNLLIIRIVILFVFSAISLMFLSGDLLTIFIIGLLRVLTISIYL